GASARPSTRINIAPPAPLLVEQPPVISWPPSFVAPSPLSPPPGALLEPWLPPSAEPVPVPVPAPVPPAIAASSAPFGVPMPVGPSQPWPALHIVVPQLPFVPDATSLNADLFSYASAGVALPWPSSAKIAAVSGLARLVPPIGPMSPLSTSPWPSLRPELS